MFIAHLPAGYLLTRWLQRPLSTNKFLWLGLVASIFPDIDLLYFYFVNHSQNHHNFFTHLPIFWLTLWGIILIINIFLKNRSLFIGSTIIFANILLHLLLDTFVAGIPWLYPFESTNLALVTIPSAFPFWVENFVFHWTFLVELAITIWAIFIFFKHSTRSITRSTTNRI